MRRARPIINDYVFLCQSLPFLELEGTTKSGPDPDLGPGPPGSSARSLLGRSTALLLVLLLRLLDLGAVHRDRGAPLGGGSVLAGERGRGHLTRAHLLLALLALLLAL